MKKIYPLLAAALLTCTATAQVDYSQKHSEMRHNAPKMIDIPAGKPVVTMDEASSPERLM